MNSKRQASLYFIFDYISAVCSWTVFFLVRKGFIDPDFGNIKRDITLDENYFYGLIIIPLLWVFAYYLNGTYKNVYRRSMINELAQTFIITFIGCIALFFIVVLDDFVTGHKDYYKSLFFLFSIHFLTTYIPRATITAITNNKIHNRKIRFNTLIIGSNENAIKLYQKLENKKKSSGTFFVGFVNVVERQEHILSQYLPHLGDINDIKSIIKKHKIIEVIIAIGTSEHQHIEEILYKLEGVNVVVKAIPDHNDIISGRVKISSLYDEPLILVRHDLMPPWQINLKRAIDVAISLLVLLVFSPLYIFIAIGVKLSSKGPILYRQRRIGIHGKWFFIYKFRSMYTGSEVKTPELTQENDCRITPFGKFIRKVRLDEIPQFYNVLIGNMSLVGPRPERQYFIDQITPIAPHYMLLLRVRPGITSWGQVKYGYASNVEEMIERLKYDIIYIDNMSILIDIKILIYTVRTVILGKGL